MTEQELARFNRGNELKYDIDRLEHEIEMIEIDFQPPYPRTVSDMKMSCVMNDRKVEIELDFDDLYECVELLLQNRKKRLKWLKDEFDKL